GPAFTARPGGGRIALIALQKADHLALPGRDGIRIANVELSLVWRGGNHRLLDLRRLRSRRRRRRRLVFCRLRRFPANLPPQPSERDFPRFPPRQDPLLPLRDPAPPHLPPPPPP